MKESSFIRCAFDGLPYEPIYIFSCCSFITLHSISLICGRDTLQILLNCVCVCIVWISSWFHWIFFLSFSKFFRLCLLFSWVCVVEIYAYVRRQSSFRVLLNTLFMHPFISKHVYWAEQATQAFYFKLKKHSDGKDDTTKGRKNWVEWPETYGLCSFMCGSKKLMN